MFLQGKLGRQEEGEPEVEVYALGEKVLGETETFELVMQQ